MFRLFVGNCDFTLAHTQQKQRGKTVWPLSDSRQLTRTSAKHFVIVELTL